ncbi:MAG: flavin-dependent oxidoreductase [Actinomycetota bacterium]
MSSDVLVAGGGIAGLTLALTCHQIGVPVSVHESTPALRPLGVGINLQPNAVRELFELGLEDELRAIGVETAEYGFYTKHGDEIWVEPRGRRAGYTWPQFSVHRGRLQMLLYEAVVDRLGPERVVTGSRAVGFENRADGIDLLIETRGGSSDGADGGPSAVTQVPGSLVVGADGLHSAIRGQMVPDEGPPNWGGAILWRGATVAEPFRGGASMALIGHATQRFVTYPISPTDPATGTALINWIAELTVDEADRMAETDWSRRAVAADFLDHFADWRFGWVDVPALVTGTDEIFVYQMVDRDPLDRWTHGRATLIGDAAHVMYPVGSNGASQSIVDGRRLGRAFLDHGVTEAALQAYEAEVRPATSRMVLQNRGKGPDWVMDLVEQRSGGVYDQVSDVVSHAELAEHAARYKGIAGFSIDELNAAPPIIPPGAIVA